MTGSYRTIVADPPWEIERVMRPGGRRANKTEVPYTFLTVDQIAALPVSELAAQDAHLYLWSTRRNFREGIAVQVARAWGFEPVGEIIWGLRNPGLGQFMANDHEPVLVAVRGSLAFPKGHALGGVHFWRQLYRVTASGMPGKVHSAKPLAFLDFVEQVSPAPRLELFARSQRLGWDTWGDEAFKHVDVAMQAVAG